MDITAITQILESRGAKTFVPYERHDILMCKVEFADKFAIIGKHPKFEDYHIIMFRKHFRYDNFKYFITSLFEMCGIPEYMLHGVI